MDILAWLGRLRKKYHVIIGLVLTIVVGYLDYVTGYEFRMEIFYLIPISYVTWFVGQRFGILFSLLSIITTEYSDVMAGKSFTSFTVEFWNVAIYLCFYVIVTVLLKLRKTLQQRESLIAELDSTVSQNDELSALLPVCVQCRKFRDDRGYRQEVEFYISKHPEECNRSLCTECAAKLITK